MAVFDENTLKALGPVDGSQVDILTPFG